MEPDGSVFIQIYWPAAREHVEHCWLAGKSLEVSRSISLCRFMDVHRRGSERVLFVNGPQSASVSLRPSSFVFMPEHYMTEVKGKKSSKKEWKRLILFLFSD